MARSTIAGSSNDPLGRWEALRLGTSSSTSGSTPDKSGASGTTDLLSPAVDAASPFEKDPLPKPASSSANSTDGSGPETGSSPLSPSGFSEGSAAPREATPAPDLSSLDHHQLMEMARESFVSGKFDEAERLLNLAEGRGASPVAVASARGYVRDARARALAASPPRDGGAGDGPSEEVPASGGFLVP